MTRARGLLLLVTTLLVLTLAACGDAPNEHAAGPSAETAQNNEESEASEQAAQESMLPSSAEGAAAVRRFAAKGLPIYCGGTKKPWIALTFDDGPGAYTKRVLALLNRANVRRTFFLNGKNVAGNQSAIRRQHRSGSAIGNHTWSHDYLPGLSASGQKREIVSSAKAISKVTGEPVPLIRQPYGARNETTDKFVKREGMLTILWDIDSEDALGANSKEISRRVKAGFRPGSIILLHENRGQTLRALKYTILPALRKSNVTPVTVPQMLAGNPPSERQLARGRDGCRRSG